MADVGGMRFECRVLGGLVQRAIVAKEKVDRENYKLLLWRCMGMIAPYCEVRNRDYVELFIEFVEGNFFRANAEDAKSCSIRKRQVAGGSKEEGE